MKKIKFILPSWDKGKQFVNELVLKFNCTKFWEDDYLIINEERFKVSCSFNTDKNTSFIVIRLRDVDLENEILQLKAQFLKN